MACVGYHGSTQGSAVGTGEDARVHLEIGGGLRVVWLQVEILKDPGLPRLITPSVQLFLPIACHKFASNRSSYYNIHRMWYRTWRYFIVDHISSELGSGRRSDGQPRVSATREKRKKKRLRHVQGNRGRTGGTTVNGMLDRMRKSTGNI